MTSRLIAAIRIFLAIVFMTYGTVKLMGGQFYYGDWQATRDTIGGPFFVWAFYGYSPFYGRVVGLFELVPAMLLLFRRTATIGAAALFAVSLNVAVMDFAFDFPPVKYMAASYTLLCGVLLLYDANKLRLMLLTREESSRLVEATRADPAKYSDPSRRLSRGAWLLLGLLGVPLILFALNLIGNAIPGYLEAQALEAVSRQGFPRDSLVVESWRTTGLSGIGRAATVNVKVRGNPPRKFQVIETRASGFVPWRIGAVTPIDAAMRP